MIPNELIKKGQQVIIRDDISHKTDTTNCGYALELNEYIGEIMTINNIDRNGNFDLKEGDGWWFSPNWVDAVEQIHFDEDLFTL